MCFRVHCFALLENNKTLKIKQIKTFNLLFKLFLIRQEKQGTSSVKSDKTFLYSFFVDYTVSIFLSFSIKSILTNVMTTSRY